MIFLTILFAVLALSALFVVVFVADLLVFTVKLNKSAPLFESDLDSFVERTRELLRETKGRVKRNALLLRLCHGLEQKGERERALNMIGFVDEKAPFLEKGLYLSCLQRLQGESDVL